MELTHSKITCKIDIFKEINYSGVHLFVLVHGF